MQSRRRITRRFAWLVVPALVFAGASTAVAQGNPTGAISGRVIDPGGLAIPGVVVTVASSALQGTRTATTSATPRQG